jgi:hypothetical protein
MSVIALPVGDDESAHRQGRELSDARDNLRQDQKNVNAGGAIPFLRKLATTEPAVHTVWV